MREIKFRAWRKDTKQMYDDVLFSNFKEEKEEYSLNGCIDMAQNTFFILMQYTGLKDKNGKEIYEEDIVKDKERISEVFFEEGMFRHGNKTGSAAVTLRLKNLEIIGNIYENKELLK